MIPPTTTGVTCSEPTPGSVNIHAIVRRATLNRAQELEEVGQLGIRDLAWRHAASRQAAADQRGELLIVARRETQRDGRTHVAAVAVAAVASGAARLERLASRLDVLDGRD